MFQEDIETLTHDGITAVIAHELGHAYCDLKSTSANPCLQSIETRTCVMRYILDSIPSPNPVYLMDAHIYASEQGANLIAQAWGFKNELWKYQTLANRVTGDMDYFY